MGIGSLRLNSMAIRGLLYQLTATIGEFLNARHYPLSHAKVQALVTPKPAKKGQVYFGRFYLGKCRHSPEGEGRRTARWSKLDLLRHTPWAKNGKYEYWYWRSIISSLQDNRHYSKYVH